jgi:type VI secretion system secreted protein VgrG
MPGSTMTDACQFGESDHNYLSWRWEAAGLLYLYEHGAAGHKLVLTDSSVDTEPIDSGAEIAFSASRRFSMKYPVRNWTAMQGAYLGRGNQGR